MCARLGAAHMRPLPVEGTDGTEGMCVRLAHMRPFRANGMTGNEGMCVRAAHMRRIPASCSRTCGRFRPESRPVDGKPGEVREPEAGKWRETGGSAREMPGNPGKCARTSCRFVPSGRKTGRNQGEVRGSLARTKGMCMRPTHMRPFRAKGMARTRRKCASGRRSTAEKRGMCVTRKPIAAIRFAAPRPGPCALRSLPG
jgi:hypothetical protein